MGFLTILLRETVVVSTSRGELAAPSFARCHANDEPAGVFSLKDKIDRSFDNGKDVLQAVRRLICNDKQDNKVDSCGKCIFLREKAAPI